MGFGSYDESEHQKREENSDEEDVEVDEHGTGHGGESTFEMDGTADDMLDQLKDIKDKAKADAEEES